MILSEDIILGMRVQMLPWSATFRSTIEFAEEKGEVISLNRVDEEYVRVRYDRRIRNRREWNVPLDDLVVLHEVPTWEL